MGAVAGAEQAVLLYNISWQTYERLLADRENSATPRFAYDKGALEIMSPSAVHERFNRLIALLVEVLAEELGVEIDNLGSTTFRREDLQRGFEPDSCFYVHNVDKVRGKDNIDLSVDPPPDIVVEIEISRTSLEKLPIYSAVGVPEIWRYDGKEMLFFLLSGREYVSIAESRSFPGLTAHLVSRMLEQSHSLKRPDWIKLIRQNIPGKR